MARVFGFALRLTGDRHAAEDLSQEAFLRAWRKIGSLRDERREKVWLFQITANLWRDQLRRRRLAPERAGSLEEELPGRCAFPDDAAEQREEVARALVALDALPNRQREVMYLSACEGMAHAEIATVLGCTTDAVKTNLSLARKKLREQFAESQSTLSHVASIETRHPGDEDRMH